MFCAFLLLSFANWSIVILAEYENKWHIIIMKRDNLNDQIQQQTATVFYGSLFLPLNKK